LSRDQISKTSERSVKIFRDSVLSESLKIYLEKSLILGTDV